MNQEDNMPSTLKLGYWDIRGYAEPIRMVLRYLDVPFEDIRYGFGSGATYPNKDEWLPEKFTLGLDFPNLPYLIDGDFKITQSVAILKYLAKKHSLRSSKDDARVQASEDMIEAQILDIRNRLMAAIYTKTYNTDREFDFEMDMVKQDLSVSLSQLEQWLSNKKWLIDDQLSYVDFLGYEYLDWYRDFVQAECFDKFPNVSEYMKRFEQLSPLKEYLASEQYRKGHCVSPFARIGY